MNPILPSLTLLLAFSIGSGPMGAADAKIARPAAPARRPAPAAPILSPEILSDGSVTFRLKAPQAKEVKVSGQFGPEAVMTKDEQGMWSATVHSVAAGIHEYRFVVDGLSVMDPQNSAMQPQRWPGNSLLHIPAHPPALWDLQDIPHGTLHQHTYKSKAMGTWRRLVVYTPPGVSSQRRLPVLYLAHGFSDNEATWSAHGKANWILDALIASKKALPMIIVMPDAHAIPPTGGTWEEYATSNTKAFCEDLKQEMIPLVESQYRVLANSRNRAFAGLSMGGHHALTVALNHHDTFGWVGAFSSAPPATPTVIEGLNHPDRVNRDLKWFWIGCGESDFLFKENGQFTALLKEKGIRHDYATTKGGHTWPVWRNYLADFAPKLFR